MTKPTDIKQRHTQLAKAGIRELTAYKPGKPVSEVMNEYDLTEVIKLASNENAYGASPKAIAALDTVKATLNHYPDGSAAALKQALSAHTGFDTDWIMLGNGSEEILHLVGKTFLSPGDEVLYTECSFEVYHIVANAADATAVTVPHYPEDDAHDPLGQNLDALLAAVTAKTKVLFIANPNNPTGTIIPADTLRRFLDKLPDHVIVVLDEAYYEFVDSPVYSSGLDWLRELPNVIVTRTFSKLYGLPGLRIGYGIAHPSLIDLINRIRQPFNTNSMAQAAAVAALDDIQFAQKSKAMSDEGRTWLLQALADRDIKVVPSHTNFLFVPLPTPLTADEAFAELLTKGIIVRSLSGYDRPNHIRVTIGTMPQNHAFIEALDAVLGAHDLA